MYENVGLIRDIAIIVFILFAFFIAFVFLVLGVALYLKVNPILKHARRTSEQVEEAATLVTQEFVKPAVERSGQVLGIGKTVGIGVGVFRILSRLRGSGKRKGGNHGS